MGYYLFDFFPQKGPDCVVIAIVDCEVRLPLAFAISIAIARLRTIRFALVIAIVDCEKKSRNQGTLRISHIYSNKKKLN